MAITAGMRQVAQLGFETTPFTPVAAIRRPTSFGLKPNMNASPTTVTPYGQTAPTGGWIAREDMNASVEGGVVSFDEVLIPLQSVVAAVTPTTPSGGTTSKQWLYGINQFASDTPQIYTTEVGSPTGRAYQAAGCFFNEWGFTISTADDQIPMTGNVLGSKLTPNAMTSLTGAALANFQPVTPQMATLRYATSAAGLSAGTLLNHAFSAGFSITSRRDLVRFLGSATGTPSDSVETPPGINFDLTIADETAPVDTFLSAFRAGTKYFFRIQCLGTTAIEAAIFPEFTLDVCCILRDTPSIDTTDGVASCTLPLNIAYDSTWTNMFQLKVVNTKTVAMP